MTRTTLEYAIMTGNSRDDLRDSVQSALNEGWELQGGVCLAIDGGNYERWSQALILKRGTGND